MDATITHANFLSSTIHTIKTALRDIWHPFHDDQLRAALVITRDYDEDISEFESTSFMTDLNDFEQELDAITPGGGIDGFCAFNAGMKEALSSDMDWRYEARKVVIVATAGIPHSIGENLRRDRVARSIINSMVYCYHVVRAIICTHCVSCRAGPNFHGAPYEFARDQSRFPHRCGAHTFRRLCTYFILL